MKDSLPFLSYRLFLLAIAVLIFWTLDTSMWVNGFYKVPPRWYGLNLLALVWMGGCWYVERHMERKKP